LPRERTLPEPKLVKLALDDVNDATYNPRVPLEPGMPEWERLEASIEKWGLVDPLVVNEVSNTLVGGHQRKRVLSHLGYKQGWFVVVHLENPDEERALNVALNRNLGRWDHQQLSDLLGSLSPDLREAAGFDRAGEEAAEMLRGAEVAQSTSFLDDFLSHGATKPDTNPDDALGGKPREIDQKQEHAHRTGHQLFEIPLVLTSEQRTIYYRAIGLAKSHFTTDNTYEALTSVLDEFCKRLDRKDEGE